MAMEFFNFGNSETFHFFKWISEGGRVKADDLIKAAFEASESDEWLQAGMDVCYVVSDKLTEALEDLLAKISLPLVEEMPAGAVNEKDDSLWRPILDWALKRIDCKAVAVALLMQAGKWSPARERPQAI